MPRYQQLADDLARLIHGGALRPGERLPSVREASRQRGVGESTVVRAYHLLEARGQIEARPRSGYFVRTPRRAATPTPSTPTPDATPVDKGERIFQLLQAIKRPSVVPLGSAFPSPLLFPHKALRASLDRRMRRLDPWDTVANLSPGNDELRRLISVRYGLAGIAIDADEIVITDGAMEALNLCLQAVTRPGDTVLIESPTFYGALQALERLGLRAVELPTDPANGVEVGAVAQAIARHQPAACWLMPRFQNPLGASLPEPAKRELVQLLAAHAVPLIEDDVYGELQFDGEPLQPAKAWDRDGNVLLCSSFSKSLAPGYRIGWAAPGRFTGTVQRLKLGASLSAAVPSQLALADYLGSGQFDGHLRALRRELHAARDAMVQALLAHFPEGTRLSHPLGGYFLWAELPRGVDTQRLQQDAIAEDIAISPGTLFSPREAFAHGLRINFGHPDDRRVNRALRRLGELAGDQLASARHPGTR